jgi:hypothetical protein
MKPGFRLSAALSIALAAGSASFAVAPPAVAETAASGTDVAAVQAELVKLTQAIMDAIPTGDAALWQKTLADDAIIVDEFGRVQDKKEAVDAIHPFPQGLSGSIEIRNPKTAVHGDTAVLQGEMFERETVFGQQLVVRYIFSNTFVRDNRAWKLIAATDVTLPTQPPTLDVAGLVLGDYVGNYTYAPNRGFDVAVADGKAYYTTKPGGPHTLLDAVAKDVFMGEGDERNLVIFRRDAAGKVVALIERRKFNDLSMKRDAAANKT